VPGQYLLVMGLLQVLVLRLGAGNTIASTGRFMAIDLALTLRYWRTRQSS
jgi:hypothetical protein